MILSLDGFPCFSSARQSPAAEPNSTSKINALHVSVTKHRTQDPDDPLTPPTRGAARALLDAVFSVKVAPEFKKLVKRFSESHVCEDEVH